MYSKMLQAHHGVGCCGYCSACSRLSCTVLQAVDVFIVINEFFFQLIHSLPLEMLESILIKAYMLLARPQMKQVSRGVEPFVVLSSVSSLWWQTLVGWPQPDPESRSGRWVQHRIQKLLHQLAGQYADLRRSSTTPCLKKVAHHTLRNIFAQG